MRPSRLVFLFVLGCSHDADAPFDASGSANADGSLDTTLDVAVAADTSDASTEPPSSDLDASIDDLSGDTLRPDRAADNVAPEGGVTDVSRDADASNDRCRPAPLRASPWASVLSSQLDAGNDGDGEPSDARSDTGADGSRGGDVSAHDVVDDRSGGGPDADVLALCAALRVEWSAFVMQNRSCTIATDCTVVGGAGACDCAMPGFGRIGDGHGDVISVSARTAAQTYLDRWSVLRCNYVSTCVADAAPVKSIDCHQGKCGVVSSGGCNLPPPGPEPCR